jgi:voltage-gated potassium channel
VRRGKERLGHTLRRLRLKRQSPESRILFRKAPLSAESVLLMRGLLVLGLLALVYTVFYLDRTGLRDNLDEHVSALDVLYFTMITITTVGYGDIVPVSDQARLFDTLIATPVRIFVWFIFLGTAYQFVIQRVIEDFKMSRLQAQLRDHVVICGFGDSGRLAASELVSRGTVPEQIVVIDSNEASLRLASDAGYIGLNGQATREELLRIAGVERARAVIIALGRDDTTLLCLLTVRTLNSDARTVVSIREGENRKLVEKAGADVVISPWQVSGYLLADGVDQDRVVEVAHEMLSQGGAMDLVERAVRSEEIGAHPRELTGTAVLAVVRHGRRYWFWECRDQPLEAGDLLITVDANRA